MQGPIVHKAFPQCVKRRGGVNQTFFPKLRRMVHTLTCNVFGEQTYVVDHGDGSLTVVDPGMSNREEQRAFQQLCSDLGAQPSQVILTHGHLDTSWVVCGSKTRTVCCTHAPFGQGHPARGPIAAQMYGVSMDPLPEVVLDLEAGQTVHCGQAAARVRVPGHAPGHVAFVCHDHGG